MPGTASPRTGPPTQTCLVWVGAADDWAWRSHALPPPPPPGGPPPPPPRAWPESMRPSVSSTTAAVQDAELRGLSSAPAFWMACTRGGTLSGVKGEG